MIPTESSAIRVLSSAFGIEELPARFAAPAPAPLVLSALRPVDDTGLEPEVARAILAELGTRSALLIRGLGMVGARSVASLGDSIFAGQPTFSTGEHPPAEDTESVYRPVRFAPSETLLWHHENSFNALWPRFIMFVSAVPAEVGGETSIVDTRLVYAQMPERVCAPLAQHGIRYERLCDGRTSRSWEQIYGTTDRDVARQEADANGEELVFATAGARIRALRPAFQPLEHGTSWFNQVLHWHPRALPDELRRMVADRLLPAFRTSRVGDGTEIAAETVDLLIQAHRAVEFAVRWQAGDVLLIDNAVVAHGRRPYRGRREHFVRMFGRGSSQPGRAAPDDRT